MGVSPGITSPEIGVRVLADRPRSAADKTDKTDVSWRRFYPFYDDNKELKTDKMDKMDNSRIHVRGNEKQYSLA